jgi:UDP-2,4-diacetamido-2,4,6-trideoxy-beta-L-altropyranose hydrolase
MPAALILRRADERDILDLFAWRNDKETLGNSKSATPVPFTEHERWFAASLTKPDRRIYIGLVGDEKVGMVRFDRVPNSEHAHIVSIAISPEFRRRGLGRALLEAAIGEMAPGRFDAEIKTENVISKKLFEACGFRRVGPAVDAGLDLYRATLAK